MAETVRAMVFVFFVIIVAVCLGLGLITPLVYVADSTSCSNRLSGLHADGYYRMLGGCFAKAKDGRFLPLDAYRAFEPTELER